MNFLRLRTIVAILTFSLVASAADLDYDLHQALRKGGKNRVDKVKKLIAKGANVNRVFDESFFGDGRIDYFTPLYYSANDTELVRALLQLGADVNRGGRSSESAPTEYSPQVFEIARALIEHGANVNAQTKRQLGPEVKMQSMVFVGGNRGAGKAYPIINFEVATPLAKAALGGNLEVVKLLLEKGANPNLAGAAGHTPLLLALARTSPDPADNGVPKEFMKRGASPLMLATSLNQPELVRLLLSRGADPLQKNAFGDSPSDYARIKKLDAISESFSSVKPVAPVQASGPTDNSSKGHAIETMRALAERHCANPRDAVTARMLVAQAISSGFQYRDPTLAVRVLLQDDGGKAKFVLHPVLQGRAEAAAAWIVYANTVKQLREQASIALAAPATMNEILKGSEAAAEFWQDAKQKKPTLVDQELDDLVDLKQHGHLASAVYFGRYAAAPDLGFAAWIAGHRDEALRYLDEVVLRTLN